MENTKIAEAFFEALASQDDEAVRSLSSPDLKVRQNGGEVMDLETMLGFNNAVGQVVKEIRYCDAVRSATENGFVEEHAVRGETKAGDSFAIPACVVAEIRDGRIVDIREYFDGAAAANLIAALGPAS